MDGMEPIVIKFKRKETMDTPNFAAWSNENLAKFAAESYIRMKEQQDALMLMQRGIKDAIENLNKALKESNG